MILVCLQNATDRELIREFLSDRYEIIVSDCSLMNHDFDLCIIDRLTFKLNQQKLVAYKKDKAPLIVPFLLFVKEKNWSRTIDPIWEIVDDVIPIPTPTPILISRIERMLETRRHSLQLKEKNEKLRMYEQAINATNAGVLITDATQEDNPIVFANRGFEELTGYRQEEILGRNCRFLQGDDRDQDAIDEVRAFIDAGKEGHVALRNYKKDGTPFWNELSIAPITNQQGEITHFVGIQNDVTELVETREKLKREKEFINAAVENMPGIFFMLNEDLNFIYWNNNLEEELGYTGEEIEGMSPMDFFNEKDHMEIQSKINEMIQDGKSEVEVDVISKSGETFRYYLIGSRLMRYGRHYIVGSGVNITEREQAYYQLRERNKEKICLYSIGSLNETYSSIDSILEEAVRIIPSGWQYPEITEAAIEYDGKIYSTPGFTHTKWGMITESRNPKSKSIALKVVYLEEKPELDEGPFTLEERELINAIVDTLTAQIERIISHEKLIESEKRWEQLVQKNPGLVQIIEGDAIQFINPAGAALYGVDSADELIGRRWTDFVHFEEEDKQIIKKRIKSAIGGNLNPPKVYRAWTVDNIERFVELQSVPVHYKGKRALMTVGQEVTERVKFEKQLQNSLLEKEILLQEIHHRVKNNLAVVSGLLQIQRFSSENELVNKVLSDSEMRIKSMALIHEKLYQAESLSEIDFRYYLEDLLGVLKRTIKTSEKISIRLDCNSVTLNVNQAVPCALIINELVSNAVEHAFGNLKDGEIVIELREKNDLVFAKVRDNGKGLPENFKIDDIHSMGFTIINTLVNQLNAEFEVSDANGAAFSFSFKKRTIKGASSTLV